MIDQLLARDNRPSRDRDRNHNNNQDADIPTTATQEDCNTITNNNNDNNKCSSSTARDHQHDDDTTLPLPLIPTTTTTDYCNNNIIHLPPPPSPRTIFHSHSQHSYDTTKTKRHHTKHHPHNRSFDQDTLLSLLTHPPPHYDDSNNSFFILGRASTSTHEYKSRFFSSSSSSSSSSASLNDNDQIQHDAPTSRNNSIPLPEFIASGGGNGIFQIPVRAPMPPGRPPSLELRPRPLRDTQLRSFTRIIACSDTQLWAGNESGLRFWNYSDMYIMRIPCKKKASALHKTGDENAAPFHHSTSMSSVFCMAMDMSSRVVWSGHKDGKIRLWKMDRSLDFDETPFNECLAWRAHSGPVLSIAISSYGDLWSGCEGGIVKVWPWEKMEKCFSLKADEKHMASLLLERSYIDLRTQVTANGVCPLSHADVHYMLVDNSRGKVWSAGYQSFALWDSRARELLKVFNIDGQISRVDMPPVRDPSVEAEMKTRFDFASKKDKSQSSLSFLQRSRNAIMGAAGAFRRAAGKGADDNHRTEALVLTGDGMIWSGCSDGLLVQWDGNGKRLRDFNHHPFAVQCLCTFGSRIWVGYVTGIIQVLNLDGNMLGEWTAHNSAIIKMAVGAGYVFTLANHGGIRGWDITSPGPLDEVLRSEVASKRLLYTKIEKLKLLTCTWNVGQGKASHDSLILWLGSAASDVGIVVVGLQEVEMGAGFLAMSAARETVGLEGTPTGQWWLETIGKHLDEGGTFERIGSRQLAGLLIALWARKNLRSYIGDVDAAAVPCGLGRAIGNKGAVGLRIRVYDRIMCFVNCHFAAHLEAVNRRNADFDHVYRSMTFNRPILPNASTATSLSAAEMLHVTNAVGIHSEDRKPDLSEADMVIFLGDLNYRLHSISYEEAKDFVSQRCFECLREKDQLRAEMKAAKVFQGMREGLITFPPTYKFQRNQVGLGGYDSSEKKRIPAWCDRVLYRDNRSSLETECSLDCPVVSSVLQYEACMDVTDSDHKPVRCIFSVDIAGIDESARRQEFGWIIGSNEITKLCEDLCDIPEVIISTHTIIVQNKDQSILRISNTSEDDDAIFEIICEGQSAIKEDGQAYEHHPRGSFGFPRWLEVNPAAGVIKPGKFVEVFVNHEEFHTQEEFVDGIPQNWWCEDTRDRVVSLMLRVRGSLSTAIKSHRIHVCHSLSSKSLQFNSKSDRSTRIQCEALQQPDLQDLDSSPDAADTQQSWQSTSLKEKSKSGVKRTIASGIHSKTLQQSDLQLNNSSDATRAQNHLHWLSMEGKSTRAGEDNIREIQPKGLQQPDVQHLNNSSHIASTQHQSHTPFIAENSKNQARQAEGRETYSKAQSKALQHADLQHLTCTFDEIDTQHNLHTPSGEEKSKIQAQKFSAGENQSTNLQHSDLHHLNSSSDAADNQRGLCISSRGNCSRTQSKVLQKLDSHFNSPSNAAQAQHSLHTLSIEENNRNEAQRNNQRELQTKTLRQDDLQHHCTFDGSDTQSSLHTSSLEEKDKKKTRENNVDGNQSMTLRQHLNSFSDAADDKHRMHTPSIREKSSNKARVNNFGGNKSKTLQQHLNNTSDAADDQSRMHTPPVRENSHTGAQRVQTKFLQQPDLQRLNCCSDAADSHTLPVVVRSQKGAKQINAEGIQSKTLQQTDLQHLNSSSNAAAAQHSLHILSIEENSKDGGQRNNATETQSKGRQKQECSSNEAHTKHSLHTLPTEENSKEEAQRNIEREIQAKTLQQVNLQHFDGPDAQHSFHTPIEEKSKNRARENNVGKKQSKTVQQPDLQPLNSSSDAADHQHTMHASSIGRNSNTGAREVDAGGVESKPLQQPDDLQLLNCSSRTADSQPSLHTLSLEEKTKKGDLQLNVGGIQSKASQQPDFQHHNGKHAAGRSNTKGIHLKTLKQPDSQYLNSSAGAADTPHSLLIEEKSKTEARKTNVEEIQLKANQEPYLQHLNISSQATDRHHGLHNQAVEGKGKSGNAKGIQGNCQQLNSPCKLDDTQQSLHILSTEENSKSEARKNNPRGIHSESLQQPDLQHLNDAADSQRSLHTPSMLEKIKSKARKKKPSKEK